MRVRDQVPGAAGRRLELLQVHHEGAQPQGQDAPRLCRHRGPQAATQPPRPEQEAESLWAAEPLRDGAGLAGADNVDPAAADEAGRDSPPHAPGHRLPHLRGAARGSPHGIPQVQPRLQPHHLPPPARPWQTRRLLQDPPVLPADAGPAGDAAELPRAGQRPGAVALHQYAAGALRGVHNLLRTGGGGGGHARGRAEPLHDPARVRRRPPRVVQRNAQARDQHP
mmetsp:Transcript_15462/g.60453  ORF Transcript_15462/g.60453 Transcript_15462/m.60453 type:complete len:224 (+) Transcript_15462:748-1419(+)